MAPILVRFRIQRLPQVDRTLNSLIVRFTEVCANNVWDVKPSTSSGGNERFYIMVELTT